MLYNTITLSSHFFKSADQHFQESFLQTQKSALVNEMKHYFWIKKCIGNCVLCQSIYSKLNTKLTHCFFSYRPAEISFLLRHTVKHITRHTFPPNFCSHFFLFSLDTNFSSRRVASGLHYSKVLLFLFCHQAVPQHSFLYKTTTGRWWFEKSFLYYQIIFTPCEGMWGS